VTPTEQNLAPTVAGPDPVVDRAVWERLPRATYKGLLQPEGTALVDQLHNLYPTWREEW
jgi:hypothetical protein